MKLITPTLKKHKEFSLNRLEELKSNIKNLEELNKYEKLCLYVTGSFGRHEATEYSDLDIFFISDGVSTNSPIPKLSKTLIDADLILLSNKMGFPPFSKDGKYLEIHYLDDIKAHLGSPNDDFTNSFTARLLLLLESYPLNNEKYYDSIVTEMIETYYRDFHDHVDNFLPIFLVNDIIRYWKTLCMNYEHSRNRPNKEKKLKTHIKNLKLVFSRKLTCFSLVIAIVSRYQILKNRNKVLDEKELLSIIRKSPIERLEQVANDNKNLKNTVVEIFELYSWFINTNNQSENKLLKWIEVKDNRDFAFDKGRKEFGGKIFNLLLELTNETPELLKYLVV